MKKITLTTILILAVSSWITMAEGVNEIPEKPESSLKFDFSIYRGSDGHTADDIMKMADSTIIAKDISADITMTLINKSGNKRVRQMSIISKEDNNICKAVMRFSSPPDVAGTGFLVVNEGDNTDMWLYLPELKKVKRIIGENKNQSFMGSDISFSDMEGRSCEDYNFTRFEDDIIEGENCYVIETIPDSDSIKSDSGYSRIIYWISMERLIPLKALFFNSNGDYFKSMETRDADNISGSWIPSHIRVEDVAERHETEVLLNNIELNTYPPDSFFSLQSLQRIR